MSSHHQQDGSPSAAVAAEGAAPLLPGYDVIGQFASGGMAEVILAWQTSAGGFRRKVVLKRIHRHLLADENFVEMFLHEGRVAAGLAHRNIAHVYDVVKTSEGEHVIVMEYIRGASLQALLKALRQRGARMPIAFAVGVALEVCEAIDYAFNASGPDGEPMRVVHRDISPSNVLVSLDGQVKLLDFGIAKTTSPVALTKAGSVKGKYGYMAPEQLRGELVDCRTDLFSLGAVLYEMTTGRRPFRGRNEAEQVAALLMDEIPRPSEVDPDFPPELERIVMKALTRDRLQRYQSPRELSDDLERCADANDWTMKSVSMGAFVKSVVGELAEPTATTVRSLSPAVPSSGSGSGPLASGTRPASEGAPPEADIPIDLEPAAAEARPWVVPALAVGGLVVVSALFWLVVFPLLP
jgi:serine/threonine-protein kinase